MLVDGAHAPGMIPLQLAALGASWYVANLHKWCCAPKGAAFVHVRRDRQAKARPLAVSHAANDPRPAPSPFVRAFDWTGTLDPTPYLVAPIALAEVARMVDGGWPAVMARNHALALGAREVLLGALGGTALAPAAMLGAMAAAELPAAFGPPPRSRRPCGSAPASRSHSSRGLATPGRATGAGAWSASRATSTTSFPTTSRSRMRSARSGHPPERDVEPLGPLRHGAAPYR